MKSLDQLTEAGGVSAGEIVAKEVEWNGNVFPFHFRDLPGGKVAKILEGAEVDANLVAATLCEEDGSPAMTLEQALCLKLTLRRVIVAAAMDVVGFSAKARDAEKKSSEVIP